MVNMLMLNVYQFENFMKQDSKNNLFHIYDVFYSHINFVIISPLI